MAILLPWLPEQLGCQGLPPLLAQAGFFFFFFCFKSHFWDLRPRGSYSCPAPEFFSKAPSYVHPKRKSRRQMSAACACSSLAVGSTATAAAPCPHPLLGPQWADNGHPAAAFHPQKRQAPPHAGPCGHATRPTQSGTDGHMQTESRDSFIAPWEVTVGLARSWLSAQ